MGEKCSTVTIKTFFEEDLRKQEYIEQQYYIRKYNDLIWNMQDAKRAGKTTYVYKVREYEIDMAYNFMDCIAFIINRLKEAGFDQVTYTPPNIIVVSWINEEIEKNKIKALHGLYIESQKPDKNVIIAPPIMWANDRARQMEHITRNKSASLKAIRTIKDRKKFIEASRQYLLN
jgi:hypothetical protein